MDVFFPFAAADIVCHVPDSVSTIVSINVHAEVGVLALETYSFAQPES
jgi:hypothetical protein